jgi:hypothetical protein
MKNTDLIQQILTYHMGNNGDISWEGLEIINNNIHNSLSQVLSPNSHEYWHSLEGRFDSIVDLVYMLYNDRKDKQ